MRHTLFLMILLLSLSCTSRSQAKRDSIIDTLSDSLSDSIFPTDTLRLLFVGDLMKHQGEFVGFDRSNDQSDKYAVHYLPTKYLIAADGTIIGKIGNDEQLDSTLAEIFAE